MRELTGFRRITLQPGETKTVTFQLGPEELTYWSTSLGRWVQEPADFDIWVGADSTATLHGEFSVVEKLSGKAPAAPGKPNQTGKYNDNTKLGTILEDEKAAALLRKRAPEMEAHPMFRMAKGMTIGKLKAMIPDPNARKMFDDVIAELNAMEPEAKA
jgi:hypothetical protein